ncbi:MAG TPA: IclR family transcriptional regulator C-terminal domain-containing protein [Aldersonia sp.]
MTDSLSGRQPKAVQSALRVLEEVARVGVGVTAKEIAANLSIPTATTYRLLNILVAEGYVVRLPDLSGFALGRKVAVIVDAAVAPTVCEAARDLLTEVRLTVRFGVHLFFFTNTAVRRADADPEYPPPVEDAVLNAHLYACAVGKLLLAEKDDIGPLIGAVVPLTARTLGPRELRGALDSVRTEGYAHQVGELVETGACVAVPIRRRDGGLAAALALSGNAEHAELLARQVPSLRDYAGRLTPLLV